MQHFGVSVESFKLIFDHVKEKAAVMQYWSGCKGIGDTSKPKTDRQVRVLTPNYDREPLDEGSTAENPNIRIGVKLPENNQRLQTWSTLSTKLPSNDATLINVVVDICNILSKRNSFDALNVFIERLATISEYANNEEILRSKIALALSKGQAKVVQDIFKVGTEKALLLYPCLLL